MPQGNLDPNKKIKKGKSRPINRKFPTHGGKGGTVYTNLPNINWTAKKLVLATALLGIPYVGAILACFIAGIQLIAYLLIGLAIFVGFIVLAIRFIDQQDF